MPRRPAARSRRRAQGDGPHPRNPEQTRARILAAARKEFAAKGFDGARVDVIAQKAQASKRMLYYYFDTKAGLFRAVLESHMANRKPNFVDAPEDVAARLISWFETAFNDRDWVRFLIWEGLRVRPSKIEVLEERRALFQLRVDQVRRDQATGLLPPDLDAGVFTMALMSIGLAPFVFPQLCYFLTGAFPTDKGFRARQRAFLERLAADLADLAPPKAAEAASS